MTATNEDLTDKRMRKHRLVNDLLMRLDESESLKLAAWRAQQKLSLCNERIAGLRREIERLDRELAFEDGRHKKVERKQCARSSKSAHEKLVASIMAKGHTREDAEKAARILEATK